MNKSGEKTMEENANKKKFLKISIIYFVILLAFVLVRIASSRGLFDAIKNEIVLDAISTGVIQIGVLFLIPFGLYLLLLKTKPKKLFQDFGYKKISAKSVLICFGIGVLAFILNIFISNFFAIILRYLGYNPQYSSGTSTGYDTFPKFLFGVLSVAILPAMCEEFVHRGMILSGTSKVIGYKKAIVLSSVLFGLMHLNISQFFYATILGLLMGLVVAMTRSIWPAVILHFTNNFINVFWSYSESANLSSFSITSFFDSLASYNIVIFFIVVLIIVALAFYGVYVLLKKLFTTTGYKNYNEMFENIEKQIRESNSNLTDQEVILAFQNYVFPNIKTPKNIFDLYIADDKQYPKIDLKYKIPLICTLVLAVLITLYTFIWGIL